MSHWDGHKIVRWPPEPDPDHPGWERRDCGCCAGIEWGGDSPRPCDRCADSGWVAYHVPSRTYALFPGGPFRGREAA